MQQYHGSCHCGAVRFSFQSAPIRRGLRCNCSLCERKGAVMLDPPVPPDALQIEATADDLGVYRFGQMTSDHFFCKCCGIYTHHTTTRLPGHYRVNLGCVEGLDSLVLAIEVFDGRNEL